MSWLAAGFLVAAIVVVRPTPRRVVAVRFMQPARLPAVSRIRRALIPALLVSGIGAVLLVGGSVPHVIVGVTAVGVVVVVIRLRLRSRAVAICKRRAGEVAEVVDALAAELGAGVLPARALAHLAEDTPSLGSVAATSRLGGDIPYALRSVSSQSGAEVLSELASAWEVSERSGAPMAKVLGRLADRLRDERELRREIDAGLGPARSTARIMAVLPVFGLAMGTGTGVNPLQTLTATVFGSLCLAAGSALACVGLSWVDAIAARAGRE